MKPLFRNRHFLALDIFAILVTTIASYTVRFETFQLDNDLWQGIALYLSIAIPVRLGIFYLHGMYARYWAAAGQTELLSAASACAFSSIIIISVVLIFTNSYAAGGQFIPRSIPFIEAALNAIVVVAMRFSLRLYYSYHRRRTNGTTQQHNTLIVGAGQTGIQVLDALQQKGDFVVVGFLDDDLHKIGTMVRGVRVLGSTDELRQQVLAWHVKRVIIAIPSASGKVIRHLADQCRRIGIEPQIMPGMYELALGKFSANNLRPIQIDDLLRRVPIHLDVTDIQQQLAGARVLITGAGGSIGMALVRQVASWQPAALILVGHGENSLFAISQRLRTEFPQVVHHVVLADVRDRQTLQKTFAAHRPQIVFHAAAHKHVPMLETNVLEALSNNVLGTKTLIELCNEFGVQRMVMLSTDKAVNPTSVMGMSKRSAELLMLHAAQQHPRRFAVVRFGNVLGSRGSVVPIFQQQIANGGPITLTSFAMQRFFMSIPEAALLVLKASVLVEAGPLFVLNMGEPVRVLDLARDLVRLSGLAPDQDIEIVEIGVRPGEKLNEELFWAYEQQTLIEAAAVFSVNFEDQHGRRFVADSAESIFQLLQSAQTLPESEVRQRLVNIVNTPYPTSQQPHAQPQNEAERLVQRAQPVPRTV
jgi:FlaA1/EpsC-like NDP-sugar epimerase